ncbi:MAG: rare lipoprotein A [Flavobacterium sp.]|jgi:rare lipoprotein A
MKKQILFFIKLSTLLLVAFSYGFLPKSDKKKLIHLQTQDTIKKQKLANVSKQSDSTVFFASKLTMYKKGAHVSYYHDKFHGRTTASGKKYDKNKYTAAHKTLPFGTMVKVTNEKNGKFIIVEITDRGPFVKGREIDLSRRAFMDITRNESNGAITATLEIAK